MANTYSDDMKKAKRELEKRNKLERIESQKIAEHELFLISQSIHNRFKAEREYEENKYKNLQNEINKKTEFLHAYASKLSYREWLTLRDILYSDHMQIQSDINRGKITEEQRERMKEISKELIL
jgi:hypothetical protein